MQNWRLALVLLLCGLTMREGAVLATQQVEWLLAGHSGEERLPPNSEMPAPVEEGEADWLLAEGEAESAPSPAIVIDVNQIALRCTGAATFHCVADGREILHALHRLRI